MSHLLATSSLAVHANANLVPSMRPEEFAALVADIRERGVKVALEVQPGTTTVLDGRTRLQAAREAGLERVPVIDAPLGSDDPVVYMLRAASTRRHLSDDQRAMLAVREKEYLAAHGRKARASKAGKTGGISRPKGNSLGGDVPPQAIPPTSRARTQAAKKHNVSEDKIRQAEEVAKADPELAEKVTNGEMTLPRARRKVRDQKQAAARQEHEEQLRQTATALDPATAQQGDCLEWFGRQPADSLHLVFGSPPYEDARLYLEGGKDQGIARDTEEWVAWMVQVYQAALRCCTGLVAFVVEGRTADYSYSAAPALLMADLRRRGITLRKPPIFHRVGIPGSGGEDWLRNDYEWVICATRGGRLPWSDNTAMGSPPKFAPGGDPNYRLQDGSRAQEAGYAPMDERNNQGPHRSRQRNGRTYQPPAVANPGNVIRCPVGGGNMGDKLCHDNEAPFPESLAEFFVRSFCPPAGIVCDPFCGSGTTGKVALQHGRLFRGCDIRASQIALTLRRLADIQKDLFTE